MFNINLVPKKKKKKGTICKVILLLLFHDSCYILCVKCVCKYETRVVINIYRFSILLQKNRDFPEGKQCFVSKAQVQGFQVPSHSQDLLHGYCLDDSYGRVIFPSTHFTIFFCQPSWHAKYTSPQTLFDKISK